MTLEAVITEKGLAETLAAVNNSDEIFITSFSVSDDAGVLDDTRHLGNMMPLLPIAGYLEKRPIESASITDNSNVNVVVSIPPSEMNDQIVEVKEIYLYAMSATHTIDFFIDSSDVNIATNGIRVHQEFETGTKVVFTHTELPIPEINENQIYYIIKVSRAEIKIAETYNDAINEIPIDITDAGSGIHRISVADYFESGLVNLDTNIITVTHPWVTGEEIVLRNLTGDMLAPLVADQIYYAIRISDTQLQIADTKENALAGFEMDLTGLPTGLMVVRPYEFLYIVAQPNRTLEYVPTGNLRFRIGIQIANEAAIFNFQYTSPIEIDEHNADQNAHPFIRDFIENFNIYDFLENAPPVKADQNDVVVASDNEKYMTPLRTKQSIDYFTADLQLETENISDQADLAVFKADQAITIANTKLAIADKATQAEAEGGVENTKYMTARRVAEAIAALESTADGVLSLTTLEITGTGTPLTITQGSVTINQLLSVNELDVTTDVKIGGSVEMASTTTAPSAVASKLTLFAKDDGGGNISLGYVTEAGEQSILPYDPAGAGGDQTMDSLTLSTPGGVALDVTGSVGISEDLDVTGELGVDQAIVGGSTVSGTEFIEGGTSLASKYLGITANAVSASVLQTGRTISLSGDASGSVVFDGSLDADIAVTIDASAHTHEIAHVTGLQAHIDNVNAILTSDDGTLDTLQEIVDFIKLNKGDLDSLGISNIAGLQTALDGKVDDSQVLTDVPAGAVFTDTVYTHPANHSIAEISGLQSALDEKLGLVGSQVIEGVAQSGSPALIIKKGDDANTNNTVLLVGGDGDETGPDFLIDCRGNTNATAISYVDGDLTDSVFRVKGEGSVWAKTKFEVNGDEVWHAGNFTPGNYALASQVLTDVPAGAVFTDTIYTHPAEHAISEITGLQAALDSKLGDTETAADSSKWDGSTKFVSTAEPTAGDGVDGDVWFQVEA